MEENGGSDGNSSVAELEVRVEALEGTAADHETRISTTETDINGNRFLIVGKDISLCLKRKFFLLVIFFLELEETISDLETRMTATEENIQGSSHALKHCC